MPGELRYERGLKTALHSSLLLFSGYDMLFSSLFAFVLLDLKRLASDGKVGAALLVMTVGRTVSGCEILGR